MPATLDTTSTTPRKVLMVMANPAVEDAARERGTNYVLGWL